VILWKCFKNSPDSRFRVAGSRLGQHKEREKGLERQPSLPSPFMGKRMIPHGGRERNFDNEPIGLSPERLEQSVICKVTLSSLRSCVKVRTHPFDVRQRRHIADGRVAPLSVVVAHPVAHNCDQIVAALSLQSECPSVLKRPLKDSIHCEYSWQALDCPWLPAMHTRAAICLSRATATSIHSRYRPSLGRGA